MPLSDVSQQLYSQTQSPIAIQQMKLALILSASAALEAAWISEESKQMLAGEASRALAIAIRLCRTHPTDAQTNSATQHDSALPTALVLDIKAKLFQGEKNLADMISVSDCCVAFLP